MLNLCIKLRVWLLIFSLPAALVLSCGRDEPGRTGSESSGDANPSSPVTSRSRAAIAGELDLRDWDSQRDGPAILNGEWRFFWKQLRVPPEQGEALIFAKIPHVWGRSAESDFAAHGFATYQLRILLPSRASAPRYALRIPDLNTAYRLEVNGQLVHTVGVVSRSPESAVSAFRPDVVWLGPGSGDNFAGIDALDVSITVSNFVLAKGGLDEPISFGTLEQLESEEERDRTLEIFTVGALGIMGVYQLILFSLRRADRRLFWFGFFCLSLALRSSVTGEYLLGRWLPSLPFVWLLALEYLTLGLGTLTIAMYLAHLFPEEFPAWFRPGILAISGIYISIALFGPITLSYALLFWFQFISVGMILFGAWRVILAVIRRREGALNTFAGGLLFSGAVMLDIFTSRGLFFAYGWNDLAPYALIVFILFQAFILSRSSARAFATAERLSIELEDRVRRRTRALNESRLQAEAANRAKSEFLATMSHELRTPLNSIIGTAELLAESSLDENQTDFVRVLNRAGRNLLFQVNDILDISRIEADRLELRPEPIDLPDLLGDTQSVLQIRADQKGLRLSVGLELNQMLESDDWIIGDPARLQQVLVNLLGNAIKFTEQGSVDLNVRADSRIGDRITLTFSVLDTGIGIESDQQKLIFESFSQADSSSSRRYEGTGLGLAISRRLVELMDGEIGVESEPGEGSRFWFRATFAVEKKIAVLDSPSHDPAHIEISGYAEIDGLRILLVEDNEDNYFLVRNFLAGSGVELSYAANGREAVETVESKLVLDLVLMDLQMPIMDGYEATRNLRRLEFESGRKRLPILALTANATLADVEKTRAGGFDGHLSKPISKKRLIAAIASACSNEGDRQL